MKDYKIPIYILIIALSILWHSQNGKYSIEHFDRNSFIKFNTRTGEAVEYCEIREPIGCMNWEKVKNAEEIESMKYFEETLERKRKEAGLK